LKTDIAREQLAVLKNMEQMKQKVLVVGGTRGIGLACAVEFRNRGCEVVVVGRTEFSNKLPKSLVDGLELWKIDLKDELGLNSLRSCIQKTEIPHIVIHAIGGTLGVADDSECNDWLRVHWLNFQVPVEINRILLEKGRCYPSRILHISSSAVFHGKASLPYLASKAALNAYVKSFGRRVLPDGVVMAALMPAAVSGLENFWESVRSTNQEKWERALGGQALGRFQSPEEIASFAVWFASETGVIFAGQALPADANV